MQLCQGQGIIGYIMSFPSTWLWKRVWNLTRCFKSRPLFRGQYWKVLSISHEVPSIANSHWLPCLLPRRTLLIVQNCQKLCGMARYWLMKQLHYPTGWTSYWYKSNILECLRNLGRKNILSSLLMGKMHECCSQGLPFTQPKAPLSKSDWSALLRSHVPLCLLGRRDIPALTNNQPLKLISQ